ncbi:Type I Iterative Polyketide synthase (PKS) [Penicillium bovifimosum]|uniref:Type I Iterative Polyketide synthase (PKS) n=1 Tax=Penicillium bovifimosum TaxID=126998 RepID=A0A9W9GY03_9EURO|nr:Type I Iterative Polyketide synthase (PKS) [Penicillium bovifimosum]KAJ5131411.1 Type I Iterative Polyketide synthase (PKS) [Penicillium bovifimosum]
MGLSSIDSGASDTILVFGSQALEFNEESAHQIRSALLESKHLKILDEWFRTGRFPDRSFPLPNILLTPLVVIAQLTQYWEYRSIVGANHAANETLGLCTGLLTAVVASSSTNPSQLQKYGGVAIRLAMAIGAVVDAQDTTEDDTGRWSSLSVAWNSTDRQEDLLKILERHPEAYISVLPETKRMTLTVPKAGVPSLQHQLKQAGLSVTEIALRGSFHSSHHLNSAESLIGFCDANLPFQFPDGSELAVPTRPNNGGDYINCGKMTDAVVRSILLEQSDWYQPFARIYSKPGPEPLVVAFGAERCVPPSLMRPFGPRWINMAEAGATDSLLRALKNPTGGPTSEEAIAVVGMSCHLPGAADLEAFWDILCGGKSQHIEAPPERFNFQTAWRDIDPKRTFYGNFIQNYDAFDHKFFKKSPREIESTDPQHRLMLQAAYQAVEQSGYFNSSLQDRHIGCFIGVGLVDYENNIACYPANAYSATGNLKAFAAGKISHYFGWTGPGLTIDTACSSSAVAVHQACKAIRTGECSAALAGGVNVMTSPEWYQNLAGASFLSPTGQCKPFDAQADGYCRAEGVGAVFLKKLSSAIKHGNQILGVIAGSAVYQNQNCTAITVPNALSLSDLFRDVVRQAKLEPSQVSVVEAHGTGTPVGDPVEYDSVRRVFGGPSRQDALFLGSVKGLLGHTESASGIVALIKVLLMMIRGGIPPQASFHALNPAIAASPSDKIEIPRQFKLWDRKYRAALINNYGASGSNASLVVIQAPSYLTSSSPFPAQTTRSYPFWLCGFDEKSVRAYSAKMAEFLKRRRECTEELTISNLSFQISRQSNRSLAWGLISNCSSLLELEERLKAYSTGQGSLVATQKSEPPWPVILCFGGQISSYIGLDRDVYERVAIFRHHLDRCNDTCASLGLGGIFPDIFQRTPISDIVLLQTSLFAVQYSCAMSWIDCGLQVAAVVGHSFGELTALCVSGILSVQDALKLVSSRARIIRDSWGPEKGAILAVEGNLQDVEDLLLEAGQKKNSEESAASIACFNGPRSFTLAGSEKAIETVCEIATNTEFTSSRIRMKKLDVTNAFHCALVEPLMEDLDCVGRDLVFRDPIIPLERATKEAGPGKFTSKFVASHMRDPVHFHHAVQRISQQYPACVWLEAGSNSTVTTMASRALGSPSTSHFQPIHITNNDSFSSLTNATTSLWRAGVKVQFWAHHQAQISDYSPILLPPYQFEGSRHWVDLKKPQPTITAAPAATDSHTAPQGLWTFMGYQDAGQRRARFRINTMNEKYEKYVSAHVIAQSSPVCASTFQLVIAVDALSSIVSESTIADLQPELCDTVSHAPMCMDNSRTVWLDAESEDDSKHRWSWKMISFSENSGRSSANVHVSGIIRFRRTGDADYHTDFARYERLIKSQRCLDLLQGEHADEVIQGRRNIYKTFSEIVQYKDDLYKGLIKLAGNANESAGRIVKKNSGETWLDLGLADSFCQVAGIFLNTMTDRADGEMYISDRIDQWLRSPTVSKNSKPETWEVFACHHHPNDKEYTSDVFVFDAAGGKLVEVIMGIHYVKVSRLGLGKLLSKLTLQTNRTPPDTPPLGAVEIQIPNGNEHVSSSVTGEPALTPSLSKQANAKKEPAGLPITNRVRELLCKLSGLESDEIKLDSDLADLGIDSLMGMELAREIELMFKCTLEVSDLVELTDFQSLVNCIGKTLGVSGQAETAEYGMTNGQAWSNGMESNGHSVNVPQNRSVTRDLAVTSLDGGESTSEMHLPTSVILDTFNETRRATDRFIEENKLANYAELVLPKSTELCVLHIVNGFEQLGWSLREAKAGQPLRRIQYLPRHEQFVEFLYGILQDAGLVRMDGSEITRTAVPIPNKLASELLQELIDDFPEHVYDHRLTYLTGSKLADCLTGKEDGLQLIFASKEGREIVSGMYGKSPINTAWIKQMEFFLRQLFLRLAQGDSNNSPIRILEMGSGTGGTTAKLVSLLARLNVPVTYTVTDLSPSLVAAARKRFKEYPFMEYRVLDIEKPPTAELLQSQHLVIATNCVHATHNLATSTRNIHQILRPDGFLMMLEMTQPLPWVDLVFGLLEGWWLFDDGRQHALVSPSQWESTMRSVGFSQVEWSDGRRPEAAIQRIIIGLASGSGRVNTPLQLLHRQTTDFTARQDVIDAYIKEYSTGFSMPTGSSGLDKRLRSSSEKSVIFLTGATGSLGSHLVAYFASLPGVEKVICVNRYSSVERFTRQRQPLESRGLHLDSTALSKLEVLETDTTKPRLGLSSAQYSHLTTSVTHIIHNAWPMSLTRSIEAYAPQFQVMRNLIDFTVQASSTQHSQIAFQFISSIATVGHYPLWSGRALAPEERMAADSVLPVGYGDAKLVCERLLDETLHNHPRAFRPMVVRIGQIAGSRDSGYWNPVEHLAFISKSSQTLKILPDLDGELSWCPVNDVAATLGELLLVTETRTSDPFYHIENPTRQSWREMIEILSDALRMPRGNLIPFKDWLDAVRGFEGSIKDNPAKPLADFLSQNFVRMSCGGLILDTTRSRAHSPTLRELGRVSSELVLKYIQAWKNMGFLHEVVKKQI